MDAGRVAAFQNDTGAALFVARVSVVFTDRLLAEAEMSAVCFVLKDPAAAEKDALLEPAGMDTLDGTFTTEFPLVKATESGAVAAPVRETVQAAEVLGASVLGTHDIDAS
jgi:hypothetical protein